MNIYKKLFVSAFVLFAFLGFVGSAQAVTPTLYLSSNSNNNVQITVTGDANSNVTLYYNSVYGMQNTFLGYTNNSGYFSTTVSTSSYNVTQGSSVYVLVNNQQSSYAVWPTYYNNGYYPMSSSGLIVNSMNLSVGNSVSLAAPNNATLYVSSNSNSGVATVLSSTFNNQGCNGYSTYSTLTGQPCYYQTTNTGSVTISAVGVGTTSITLCQNNSTSACTVINVNVTANGSVYNGSVLGASTCTFYRTLKMGMSGSDVSCLQSLLASKGYLVNSNYSSYFDIQTKNAVMVFQQDNYLYADGVVGRRTASLLYNY